MEIRQMVLPEFEEEMKKTRTMLERVPEGKQDYKPHEKSMALGKLAAHTARMPEYANYILTLPGLDAGVGNQKPLVMESREQLLADFDAAAQQTRDAISNSSDAQWEAKWKFTYKGHHIMEESRLLTYRTMFLNHLIHHRAQLGVYLRLNDIPLPGTYGPSADDTMGF
ncbi:MAG TPA: DinB family protein [Acidobacteriaceae bacterium]|nr:DinB family protein [Acidobacteriaceae bacterium]